MQTVVYACTDLGYDQIFSPVAPTPGATSCSSPPAGRGWCAAGAGGRCPTAVRGLSPTLANRYAKFFPERMLPEGTRVSVYLDANTLVLADLTPLVAEFVGLGRRHRPLPPPGAHDPGGGARFRPAGRQDRRKPTSETGAAQLRRYRAAGLPHDAPFTENAIIFRRHGSPALAAAMALWWAELEAGVQARPAEPGLRAPPLRARGQALGLELQVPRTPTSCATCTAAGP